MGHLPGLIVIVALCVLCRAQEQQSSSLPSSTTTLPPSTTTPTTPVTASTTPLATSTTPVTSSTTPLASSTETSQSDEAIPEKKKDSCNCGRNSKCDWNESLKESQCSCLDGFDGPPPNCRPGPKLWEVCYEGNPCGPDSECETDEDGKRFCRCAKGYFGCPPNCEAGPRRRTRCKGCGPNSQCDEDAGCHCLPGFVGEPPACTAGKALLKICDPYPCGGNSGCVTRNDISWCYCLAGFVGAAPDCRPGPDMWRLCVKDAPCGFHSSCEVRDGAPMCSPCSEGYSGTPPDCVKEVETQKQADTNTTRI